MDTFHEDEINFGEEEAIRMHANARDWKHEAAKWLRTTTGQEFLDELCWYTVGTETLNSLLREFGANVNKQNRTALLTIADHIMTKEGY